MTPGQIENSDEDSNPHFIRDRASDASVGGTVIAALTANAGHPTLALGILAASALLGGAAYYFKLREESREE